MCCSQGSEGRSSIGRRLAAVAAGVVATALMLGCSLAMGTVANAQEGDSPVAASQEGNGNKHFMVYYRAWRDVTMKGVNTDLPDDNWISMYDIPYGIDVVNVFSYVPSGQEAAAQPFYDKLKSDYAPYLHARGIKLVRGLDYSGVMVDGFKTWIAQQGKNVDSATESDYDAYADHVIETYMTSVGLDGLDIDMETFPDAAQVAISDQSSQPSPSASGRSRITRKARCSFTTPMAATLLRLRTFLIASTMLPTSSTVPIRTGRPRPLPPTNSLSTRPSSFPA